MLSEHLVKMTRVSYRCFLEWTWFPNLAVGLTTSFSRGAVHDRIESAEHSNGADGCSACYAALRSRICVK